MANKFPKPVTAYAAVSPENIMSLTCYEHAGENPLTIFPHSKWKEIPVTILPTEQYEAMVAALGAYRNAQRRMLEKWADGDAQIKADLWRDLHACELAADAALAALKEQDHG